MTPAKLKLRTYLDHEQLLADGILSNQAKYLTLKYNAKFSINDLLEILSCNNEIAARRIFNEILSKRDVYVDTHEMNRRIHEVILKYNEYATLIGFSNCVGDEIAEIAFRSTKSVSDVWPIDVFNNFQSSVDVYSKAQKEFRQEIRERASKKLNFVSTLGVYLTLPESEINVSTVGLTPVEELCSWIDLTSRSYPGLRPIL